MPGGHYSTVSRAVLDDHLSVRIEVHYFPITMEFWLLSVVMVVLDQDPVEHFERWVFCDLLVVILASVFL